MIREAKLILPILVISAFLLTGAYCPLAACADEEPDGVTRNLEADIACSAGDGFKQDEASQYPSSGADEGGQGKTNAEDVDKPISEMPHSSHGSNLGGSKTTSETGYASVRDLADEKKDSGQSIANQESNEIEEGVYEIVNSIAGKALDINGGSAANGANAQVYRSNQTTGQRWRIERSGNHYILENVANHKVLDVSGGAARCGANVQLYERNGTNAQLWDFIAAPNGGYYLRSCLGSFVLDVSGGSPEDYANVQIYDWNESKSQIWSLVAIRRSIEDGLYSFSSSAGDSKVIDVAGGALNDSAAAQVYQSNSTLSQYWSAKYDAKTGYYTLRSACSGKLLDACGGGTSNGTPLQQYEENGTPAQWWSIVKNEDGSITFLSAKCGLAIDVPGGAVFDGNRLQLYSSNHTAAQRWMFSSSCKLLNPGLYQIVSRLDEGRVIDVSGASTKSDASTQVWMANGTLAQKWVAKVGADGLVSLKNANSGLFLSDSEGILFYKEECDDNSSLWFPSVSVCGGLTLRNMMTNRCLDLSCGNTQLGTTVQTYAANATASQAWRFIAADVLDDGYYSFGNSASSWRCLDVTGASAQSGTRIQLFDSNGTNAQKWQVRKLGDGSYSIMSCVSGKYLDVSGANALNAVIQQWDGNGTPAQKWCFEIGEKGGIVILSSLENYALISSGSLLTLGDSREAFDQRWVATKVMAGEQAYALANDRQKRIVSIAQSTPSPGAGLCAMWVSRVFADAGYGYEEGDACDMFWKRCYESDLNNLLVGMIVAVPSHPHTSAGYRWGHIGIYIGNGLVMDNVGQIRTISLSSWLSYYGATYQPKWGWCRGEVLG